MTPELSYRRDIARAVISRRQLNAPVLEQLTFALVQHEAYSYQIIDGRCLWRLHQETYAQAKRRYEHVSLEFLVNLLRLAFELEDLWKIHAAYHRHYRQLPYMCSFKATDGSRYSAQELLSHPDPRSVLNNEAFALLERLQRAVNFSTRPTANERLIEIMGHIIIHGIFNP